MLANQISSDWQRKQTEKERKRERVNIRNTKSGVVWRMLKTKHKKSPTSTTNQSITWAVGVFGFLVAYPKSLNPSRKKVGFFFFFFGKKQRQIGGRESLPWGVCLFSELGLFGWSVDSAK